MWEGRPGVPMPQQRATTPAARRTTYDPRVNTQSQRPGQPPMGTGFPNRPGQGGRRPGMGGPGSFGRPRPGQPVMKRPVNVSTLEMSAHKKVIKIEEHVTLQQLAAKMSLKVTDVLMRLLSMGMPGVNINSSIDSDTAKILASEFGWTVEDVAVSEEATLATAMGFEEGTPDEDVSVRPPIVTVMGHVDHGKTSLLDRIRKASVAAGEAGGITQHIGAYRVETSQGTIAFLDTPGHEAFTAMRARGAQATDIVVLVVAADDGVMPQTKEAINHAQSAKVPIVVAVNKIDKPSADTEKIKRELANLGLQPEEWGGQTMFRNVSALTGQGVDELLEAILLQSEVLELSASAKKRASGVVIEALLDRGRGPVARIMVQDGTLKTGDILLAGPAWGKVRAMTDEHGRALQSAGPSTPVEVLGLNEVPSAGDPVHAVKDGKTAEEIAETRRKKANKSLIPNDARVSLEELGKRIQQGDQLELKLIIKGDVQGSVEAVASALSKLTTPKVKVTIVNAAVGGITEGDVNLAIASKAVIVGFNVRPTGKASGIAESGGIEIRLYNIIYNAVDDIRSAMEGLLPTTKVERELGKADIRQVFKITKVGTVAGCYVTSGSVKRGCDVRLVRDSIVVWTGKIASLRRLKDDVKEVAEGLECGISLENYDNYKEGDVLEAFEVEEVKTKLT
ncbi:MAG: translation initiation factor IF-2 [Polyangiaceae bacterium]